jgi:hypothetical protein
LPVINNRLQLERFILVNGHLRLEGDETTVELREALLYLRQHTYRQCRYPEFGTPIGAILPDISALLGSALGRPPRAKNVATRGGRL